MQNAFSGLFFYAHRYSLKALDFTVFLGNFVPEYWTGNTGPVLETKFGALAECCRGEMSANFEGILLLNIIVRFRKSIFRRCFSAFESYFSGILSDIGLILQDFGIHLPKKEYFSELFRTVFGRFSEKELCKLRRLLCKRKIQRQDVRKSH